MVSRVLGAGVTPLLFVLLLLVVERRVEGQGVEGVVPREEDYPALGLDYPGEAVDYPGHPEDLGADGYYTSPAYIFMPDLSNTTIRKCQCEGDEVWGGGACHPYQTIVAVFDPHSGQRVVANTSSFGRVKVGQVRCPHPRSLVLLDSNRHIEYIFSILESGDLHWREETFSDYCVDHTYDPHGQPTSWEAHVCLLPPSVPQCCPLNFTFHVDDGCVPQAGVAWAPPVLVEGQAVEWPQVEGDVVNITCDSHSETRYVKLGGTEGGLVYTPQGAQLLWTPPAERAKLETLPEYCVGNEAGTASQYVAKVCYKDHAAAHREACTNTTCIRKCCPEGTFFYGKCEHVIEKNELWQPEFFHPDTLSPAATPPHPLTVVSGFPLCPTFFQLESHINENDKFYLLTNGSLHVPIFARVFPSDKYCIDNFYIEGKGVHTLPLVCFEEDSASTSLFCQAVQLYIYPVLLVVSCVFLTITLLIYVSVPELHAKVHGKCLVSHVSSLLLAYVSLVTVQWTTEIIPLAACKVMASVTHFSFMAAFFWLNVMCFDIWWTLKSMRPVAETGELSRLRFKMYSVYAWGCPIVVSLVAFTIQALPEHIELIRPGFGNKKCWFQNDKSLWAYFYGFVLVLVVANVIFFAQVAYILLVAQNDPILQRTRAQNRERSVHVSTIRMWLYIKLFLVMGLTWLTEVISWQEGTCEAWMITDIVNTLQGFSIFLIFICKRNMLRRIRNNWEPYLRRVKEFFGSSRPTKSATGKGSQESSSFSSSVNRPSHSAASQRTVQSQISLDPTSASRKLSSSSLVSTTGVQVHSPNSISMDTINEVSSPEGEQAEKNNGLNGHSVSLSRVPNPANMKESTFSVTGSQYIPKSALNTNGEQTGSDHLPDNNNEPSLTTAEKVASLRTPNEVNTRQVNHETPAPIGKIDSEVRCKNAEEVTSVRNTDSEVILESAEEISPPRNFVSEMPSKIDKEVTQLTESENSSQNKKFVNAPPENTNENNIVRTQEQSEVFGISNGSVLPRHHRAFTTEDEDDQPVDV
nr:uncharacterized protein LOC123766744 isoform X1 [Procambarus clarkii]XP_045612039.1 uncharacterized protein LOC123766744 isoform X1 [Procambarus clarkii]